MTSKLLKMTLDGLWKKIKLKIFHKQSNIISPLLFMKSEGLSILINSLISSTMKKIILFGVRLLVLKDSFGLRTILGLLLLFKKREPVSIINLTNHGGVRFPNNFGETRKKKDLNPRNSFKDFGMRKCVTKEIKLYSYLRTWIGQQLKRSLILA